MNPLSSIKSSAWLASLGIGYLLLCRLLRYRNEKSMRRRYGYPDRASLSRMTTTDAQKIIAEICQWEFPQFAVLSLQFGLFKVRCCWHLELVDVRRRSDHWAGGAQCEAKSFA